MNDLEISNRPEIGVLKFSGNTDAEIAQSQTSYDDAFATCWKAADAATAHMPKSHDHKARSRAWKAAFKEASKNIELDSRGAE